MGKQNCKKVRNTMIPSATTQTLRVKRGMEEFQGSREYARRTHRALVLDIRQWLEEFCTQGKGLISAAGYNWLDCMVQDIDHALQELDRQTEGAGLPPVRVVEACWNTRANENGA